MVSSDFLFREAYEMGVSAANADLPRGANPFRTSTSQGRMRYVAWKKGWTVTTYRKMMKKTP